MSTLIKWNSGGDEDLINTDMSCEVATNFKINFRDFLVASPFCLKIFIILAFSWGIYSKVSVSQNEDFRGKNNYIFPKSS